jgi:hypothetical protein
MKGPGVSVYQLTKELGMDTVAAHKWLALEKLKPLRVVERKGGRVDQYFDHNSAVAVLSPHCRGRTPKKENLNPETGESNAQFLLRQKGVQLRMKNEEEQARISREWIPATDVMQAFKTLADKLDNLPSKLKSETGLTDAQTTAIRRALDDAREGARKEILKS